MKCWINTTNGPVKADVEYRMGDYAITLHGDSRTVTHLPTGVSLTKAGDTVDPHHFIAALQSVPRFDMQTFRNVRRGILEAYEIARAQ